SVLPPLHLSSKATSNPSFFSSWKEGSVGQAARTAECLLTNSALYANSKIRSEKPGRATIAGFSACVPTILRGEVASKFRFDLTSEHVVDRLQERHGSRLVLIQA